MRKRMMFVSFIFLVFFIVLYGFNGFSWLDHRDIEWGRAVVPLNTFPLLFLERFADTGFYRPIVALFHSIDFAVSGRNPLGYHVTNVILHILAAYAAVSVLSRNILFSKNERSIAYAVALIHPVSWVVVGSVSYRQESLMMIFVFCVMYCFEKYLEKGMVRYGVLWFIASAGALLSKETALYLLPVLSIVIMVQNKKRNVRQTLRVLQSATAGILLYCSYAVLRARAVAELWRTDYFEGNISEQVGTRIAVMGRYIWYLVLPVRAPLSDVQQIVPVISLPVVLTILVIGVLVYLFVIRSLYGREGKKLWVMTAVLLLPALQIIPAPRFFSIHYAYGAALLTGGWMVLSMRYVFRQFQPRSVFLYTSIVFCAVWIIFAVVAQYNGGRAFYNDFTLFTESTRTDPRHREGHAYLGDWYLFGDTPNRVIDEKTTDRLRSFPARLRMAIYHYEKALAQPHGFVSFVSNKAAQTNLAIAYAISGRYPEALQRIDDLRTHYPDDSALEMMRLKIAAEAGNAR